MENEGFRHTYVWEDDPKTFYPDHKHGTLTAHMILRGEMTLTTNGRTETYRAGQRCDVPAGRGAFGEDVSDWLPVFDRRVIEDG